MRTIWKYELDIADIVTVHMPARATILPTAHAPAHDPYAYAAARCRIWIWAEVDTDQPKEPRHLAIIGTGNPIDPALQPYRDYLATVVTPPYVWHIYQLIGYKP